MEQEFYAHHSNVTDPRDLSSLLVGLPNDLPALSKVVRGAVVHRNETFKRFGFEVPQERFKESEIRFFRDIVQFLGGMHERPADQRLAGTCRDFCITLCAVLRQVGIPARMRGGYADYFPPYAWDDHWVVEYWLDGPDWQIADPQMAEAAEHYAVDFDVDNVPRERFVTAGEAWLACRGGDQDPAVYTASVIEQAGMGVIQGTVVRDLAALNRLEVFPWDSWGLMTRNFDELTEEELTLLDQAAEIGAKGGPLDQAIRLYQEHPQLQAPAHIVGS
ncbi:transglutaminase-like domain-containing protein [Streptomyces sp. CA-250714]|uniref:transglutaminase-like domain-containing protein n=1 Tax=Streptomyces sp. CA-250714 TaxID=3240060 RepID=UPI003D91F10E